MRQQTISIKFSEEKVFVRWCDGVGREGEEELPLAGRLQWTGIPRVQFPPFSALYFSSPHTSEQSELCKWALLQNAQLEQLGMDSSFQITRASSETTGWTLLYSSIPCGMARRKRLWAMSCGNSCLIHCLCWAVGSCSSNIPSDPMVHGQHSPVAIEMTDFSCVGCLEHSTAAAKSYGQNNFSWPMWSYFQVPQVHWLEKAKRTRSWTM